MPLYLPEPRVLALSHMLDSPRARWLVVGSWVVLVGALLPVREVMPPDESRFTQQAQEMKESSDWIVPTIGGLPNADKPPLLFWAIGLVSLPFPRVTEVTARIPSALAALAVLLLTMRLGRRLWGSPAVGAGAALILLTGIEFFQKAQWVSCDMLLTAWTMTAITLWREALFEDRAGAGRIVLGWVAAAAGVLTKGPVGLLWPVLWLVSEAAARGRWRVLARLPRSGGPVVFALLVGGWLAAFGSAAGWPYLREAMITQNLTRYAAAWNSVKPWYFYFSQAPADLLPWSFLMPGIAILVIDRVRTRDGAPEGIAVRAAALFFLLGFLFFSGSSGKRGVYLLPSFPAFALLASGAFLRPRRPGEPGARWRTAALVASALLGAVVGIGVPLVAARGISGLPAEAGGLMGAIEVAAVAAGGLALALGAAVAIRRAARGASQGALAAVTCGLAGLLLVLGVAGGSAWSKYQGGRLYGREVASLVPAGRRIAIEWGKFELILFYSERMGTQFETDEQLRRAIASGLCSHAILKAPRFESLRDEPPLDTMSLLDTTRVGGTTFYLLGPDPKRVGAAGRPTSVPPGVAPY